MTFQASEFLYHTPDLTLGFDATTQGGVHVNAINVHNENTEYTLVLDELAGKFICTLK